MILWGNTKKKKEDECDILRKEVARLKRELRASKEKEWQVKELDRVAKMLVHKDMEVTRLNDELIEIDRAKSHFITVAAHQLRTPLSIVKWTFRMLLTEDFGALNDEQKNVVERGYNVNEGTIKLISDLLDVARIETGRFAYKFERISLEDIITKVFMLMKPRAEERKIEFEVSAEVGQEFFVTGDRISLETALENLVANAINYTSPGGRVDIIYKKADSFLEVQVKDTGVGIPAHQLSRLYTKFFRGNNVIKMQTSGSGLGLFIVKSVMNVHGGEVGVESEEGKGTTFWFRIPIRK